MNNLKTMDEYINEGLYTWLNKPVNLSNLKKRIMVWGVLITFVWAIVDAMRVMFGDKGDIDWTVTIIIWGFMNYDLVYLM
jgi:hypothetical protein